MVAFAGGQVNGAVGEANIVATQKEWTLGQSGRRVPSYLDSAKALVGRHFEGVAALRRVSPWPPISAPLVIR